MVPTNIIVHGSQIAKCQQITSAQQLAAEAGSASSPGKIGLWSEVRRGSPCPICSGLTWCAISPCGNKVRCRRQPIGCVRDGNDKNGAPYYIHNLEGTVTPPPPLPSSTREVADLPTRHRVYERLIQCLGLSQSHRAAFRNRGLTEAHIDRAGYRTWPLEGRAALLRRLQEDFSPETLLRVPGVWVDAGRMRLAGSPGLLIPVRDAEGNVVACMLRADAPKGPNRYSWLSSRTKGGPSSGTPPHTPIGTPRQADTVRAVEGILKADVTFALDQSVPCVGFSGCGNWQQVIEPLKAMGCTTVRLALDGDWRTNENVKHALVSAIPGLRAAGFNVLIEDWPFSEQTKGIDDAILAGVKVEARRPEDVMGVATPATDNPAKEGEQSPRPVHLTDTGNAQRMVASHGADLRHVSAWGKWLLWDGKRWKKDETSEVARRAKATVAALYRDATKRMQSLGENREKELERLQKIQSWAVRSESAPRIKAMIEMAQSEPTIPVLTEHLDSNHWLLNCRNGTLDLATGNLREHRRDDLITHLCPTDYDHRASAPLWCQTLSSIFAGNEKLVGYFQRLCGYCLTGDTREQILPILWGSGSNGKSLLLHVISIVLGTDYADAGADELMASSQHQPHPTFMADLFGKRLVTLAETREGGRLNESLVKKLTGGDTVKARRMREDFWSFEPTHKIWIATNHKPEVRGTDHGIWRRLRLLPFTVRFWDRSKRETGPANLEADKKLPGKLKAEATGILAWMVHGCMDWQKIGLAEPDEVTLATADYRSEQDVVSSFFNERCEFGPGIRCRAKDVYAAFSTWHTQRGERGDPMSQRKLWEQLEARGIEKKVSNGTWYTGIRLLPEEGRTDGEDMPTPWG